MNEGKPSRCSGHLAGAVILALTATVAHAESARPEIRADRICMVEGETAEVYATVSSADPKVAVRLYFRSHLSPRTYFVKMAPVDTPAADAATWRVRGLLPRPAITASPVAYRAEAVSAGGTSRSSEIVVKVVKKKSDCDEGLSPATVTEGVVTVFDEKGAAAGSRVLTDGGHSLVGMAAEAITAAVLGGGAVAYLTREPQGGSSSDVPHAVSPCR